MKTFKQYLSLRGLLARRLRKKKEKYSASNYAKYLFEESNQGIKNMYLEFLVEDLCKELSRYINDNPEAIKQRVIKEYGLNCKFTEEEMKHVLKVHRIEKNDTYKNYLWHGHIGRTITKKQSDEWEYQCSAYEKAKDSLKS